MIINNTKRRNKPYTNSEYIPNPTNNWRIKTSAPFRISIELPENFIKHNNSYMNSIGRTNMNE